jgi:tetratricopeptide (TPR) repeat protein
VRDAARAAVARAADAPETSLERRARSLPEDVRAEVEHAVGRQKAPRFEQRLAQARIAFEAERYGDARRILADLASAAPGAASVHELLGLTYYRMGRWKQAIAALDTYRSLTSSVDQHPVLADCYRALGKRAKVDALWSELKDASPSPELMAEGRMVMAGALADAGDLRGALALLAGQERMPPRVRPYHLRQWYVIADLYDRAGELPRARALFQRIHQLDPGFADVDARLFSLGR